jgi:hypothetical protein
MGACFDQVAKATTLIAFHFRPDFRDLRVLALDLAQLSLDAGGSTTGPPTRTLNQTDVAGILP